MTEIEELRASRARVLEAADAERRRTERSLHDGVQQHLVALAVNLQLARQLVDTNPAALPALLDELSRDVHEALESVRALASEVYPPLLLDLGLAAALRGAGVKVATDRRYPPAIEAAAYFCCIDLLRPDADIRIWDEDDTLVFAANGEPSAVVVDRVATVGGTLTTENGRITGRIPLTPPRRDT